MKEIEEPDKVFPYFFDKDKQNWEYTLNINSTKDILKFIEYIKWLKQK